MCYQQANRERELERYLHGLMSTSPSRTAALAYAVIRNGMLEPEILRDCVEDFIAQNTVLAGLIEADRLYVSSPNRVYVTVARAAVTVASDSSGIVRAAKLGRRSGPCKLCSSRASSRKSSLTAQIRCVLERRVVPSILMVLTQMPRRVRCECAEI